MNVHIVPLNESELYGVFIRMAEFSRFSLKENPNEADLILMVGNFSENPRLLLDHPVYRAHFEKAAVYTEDDAYLPLIPGVYCSAKIDAHSKAGRVFSYSYITSNGKHGNRFVEALDPPTAKTLLFSFLGASTSMLRKRLFNLKFDRDDILVQDTNSYHHWDNSLPGREEQQKRYAETMASSHFVLCPRGAGTGTIRFFEVMSSGIAPVLIADDYPLPPGVDWDSFLIRVAEKDCARLPDILEQHIKSSAQRGRRARQEWLKHFAPATVFNGIAENCLCALRHGPPSEEIFRRGQARDIAAARLRVKLRGYARNSILETAKFLRISLPYKMR